MPAHGFLAGSYTKLACGYGTSPQWSSASILLQ
jgi:hypothetical protein